MTDKQRLVDWLGQWLVHDEASLGRIAQNLLDKGVTLPPAPEPPCVSKASAVIAAALGTKDADWSPEARALHAAGLCSCTADALLRRWDMSCDLGDYFDVMKDTRTYLEGR